MAPSDTLTKDAARMRRTRAQHRADRQNGRLVTVAAAADALGMPYSTLRNIVARGLIPVIHPPGSRSLWLDRADLEKAIAAWKGRAD